jgi:hypothetical protein
MKVAHDAHVLMRDADLQRYPDDPGIVFYTII